MTTPPATPTRQAIIELAIQATRDARAMSTLRSAASSRRSTVARISSPTRLRRTSHHRARAASPAQAKMITWSEVMTAAAVTCHWRGGSGPTPAANPTEVLASGTLNRFTSSWLMNTTRAGKRDRDAHRAQDARLLGGGRELAEHDDVERQAEQRAEHEDADRGGRQRVQVNGLAELEEDDGGGEGHRAMTEVEYARRRVAEDHPGRDHRVQRAAHQSGEYQREEYGHCLSWGRPRRRACTTAWGCRGNR